MDNTRAHNQTAVKNASQPLLPFAALYLTLGITMVLSPKADAEITEIDAAAMDQSYIGETLATQSNDGVVTLNVSDEPSSGGLKALRGKHITFEGESYKEGELLVQDRAVDSSYFEQNPATIRAQAQTANIEQSQQLTHEQERQLRSLLSIRDTAIDLNTLKFPVGATPSTPPPSGTSYQITPTRFQVAIPNTKNYAPTSLKAPGGQYDAVITTDKIVFNLNLSNRQ